MRTVEVVSKWLSYGAATTSARTSVTWGRRRPTGVKMKEAYNTEKHVEVVSAWLSYGVVMASV